MDLAPDLQNVVVDGETFEVRYDPDQPGAYQFAWLSGPNAGYGFSMRASTHTRQPQGRLLDAIVEFLKMIDPNTGYLAEG